MTAGPSTALDEDDAAEPARSSMTIRLVTRVPWALVGVSAVTALALYHAYLRFWLCDDAFISFRYARQLVDGYGLVFNRGERVEGYTNFLWVLEVALGMKLGLAPEMTSTALSVAATVALFFVVARSIRSSPLAPGSAWPALFGLLLLAANRSVAVWTTSGLETRQFTLLSTLAVVHAGLGFQRSSREGTPERADSGRREPLRAVFATHRHEFLSGLFAALAEATRPEGGLVLACVGAAYVLVGPLRLCVLRAVSKPALREARTARAARALRGAALLVGPAVALVAAHYVFRRLYYGDWLPNTYHAKHVRPWLESGDKYFVAAWIEHGTFLLYPVAALGLVARLRRGDALHVFTLALVVAHTIYVRRIGGDHFEFRPLDLHWPLLTIAAVDGLLWIGGTAQALGSRLRLLAMASLWLLLFEYSTVVQRAYENETHGLATRNETYKLRALVQASSTREIGFFLPHRLMRMYNDASFYCVEHQSCTRQGEHRAYWQLLREEFGPYLTMSRQETKRALPDDLVWARDAVGYAPYVLPGVTVIDLFGLTDRTIARNPVLTPNDLRVMAHDRRPPTGYLEERGMNIQIAAAARTQGEALRRGYWAVPVRPDLWIPFGSYDASWVVDRFKDRHVFSQFWFDPDVAANNRAWIDGKYTHGLEFLGRFDGGDLDGWTTSDARAVATRPSALAPTSLQALGAGYLSTNGEAGLGGTAHVRSLPFTARGILAFVVAGDGKTGCAVRLLRGGDVLHSWVGHGASGFELSTLDLAPWRGTSLMLEVVDESTDGSVLLDQVMLVVPDGEAA